MTDFKPEGWPSVVPRLFAADAEQQAQFLKDAFDAVGEIQTERPSELNIDGSIILVSDGGGVRGASESFLYLYVRDCDATYVRAVALGADGVEAPTDVPYGERRATIRDPAGNTWQIATKRA